MGALAPFLRDLDANLPPRWPAGELLAAWRVCEDVDEMIALLRKGAAIGVFETAEVSTWEKGGVVQRWLFRLRHAERFYRIDVRREDGAGGVRRSFPDFPDDWSSALSARLDEMSPLDRLLADLRSGRPIAVDREAAQRAWERCAEPFTMVQILRLLRLPIPDLSEPARKSGSIADYEAGKRRMVAALRAAHPRLPLG